MSFAAIVTFPEMNWMNSLEKRFGRFAIPGLVRIIVAFNALVYLLYWVNPYFISVINLQPDKVLSGQLWRLVSYIFIPPMAHPVFIIFALWFLWMIGEGLEEHWGSFRLNLFYLIGMAGTTVAAFVFRGDSGNGYLNLSLLFAFATIYPNFTILFMLILPLKMKWVALISLFFVVQGLVVGPMFVRAAIIVSLGNYLLFFGPTLIRTFVEREKTQARRRKHEAASMSEDEALHRCTVCGRTDLSHPELEFRVGRDGEVAPIS